MARSRVVTRVERTLGARAKAHLVPVALALAACSHSLPGPKTGPHPPNTTTYIEVPFPPPAAHVEIVPPKPRDGAVWVDGEWDWEGKNWVWETGGWMMPPERGYLAPWVTYRQENGKLLFAPGTWYGADGAPMAKPPLLASAESSLESQPSESVDAGPVPGD